MQTIARFWRQHGFLLKLSAAALILGAIFFLGRWVPVEPLVDWLKERVAELGAWAPVAFIVLFVGLTTILLPGWPLNAVSGVLFGPWAGGALSSVASTTAAAVSFLIGRFLARGWIARNVSAYPRLNAVYCALGRAQGWKIVAAVRLSHSLPFGLQNLLLGASPVRFVPYVLTTWLVTLPGTFMFAYSGYLAGTALSADDAPGPWFWVVRGAGLVVAVGALIYLGKIVFQAIHGAELTQTDAQTTGAGAIEASTSSGK